MERDKTMKQVDGGVCAAKGYQAAGVYCGIRKNKTKKDLALIYSETKAACACVYTQNLVKGAPILVTKANVAALAKSPFWNVGSQGFGLQAINENMPDVTPGYFLTDFLR